MTKKDIIIGFIVGVITNIIGLFIATKVLGKGGSFIAALETAKLEGFLNQLISLGAILNLIAFFYFLKKRQDNRAKGVLIATIIVALLTFAFKFL
ncbi:hypothetical protein [Oceanihabitans sediminis]|uniref:Uncharacterized protein n=1 Tax=Oceanihabitans sediminis TaxID=1812012 RepID=A0A368P9B4_9FLAO|nr:hypothetical protein [Oceanihabitans sediminis]MDX1278182.1 hypothetical protein [Oceanihabitans sediminis]MDX1773925.1 hypothetical protein [Oceanihabitans sediminis]RBP32049.1 hypothetical protein DFR65_10385 [Oceanihabitans sediminis]RCU58704.1 hypothetical protein DU428_04850 [Oceanihabitans sediminis]